MTTLTKKNKGYSFEKTLEIQFQNVSTSELENRLEARLNERQNSSCQDYKDKLSVVIKMIKRELIKRGVIV